MRTTDDEVMLLLDEIADALNEIYEPAGVLLFWSSRIIYLDHRRPCDLLRDRDVDGLRLLAQRVNAAADGAFA